MAKTGWLARVCIGGCLVEFLNNCLSEFATLTALARHTELRTQISHIARTTTAQITNLIVGNLSANAYVHGVSSVWQIL